MPFYHLTASKTRDVFHNSGPLALLRLKNTWVEALISVDLLKTTLLHIFIFYFHNGFIFGRPYIRVYVRGDLYLDFFNKVARACNFIKKEFLAQVFSCEFCEISKNAFS